jgi:hypothetical protein
MAKEVARSSMNIVNVTIGFAITVSILIWSLAKETLLLNSPIRHKD